MTFIEMGKSGGGIGLDGRNEKFYSSHAKFEKEAGYLRIDVK